MVETEPGIHLIRAPNPSPLTLDGTNSYLLETGDGRAVIIDPGPALESHAQALAARAAALGLKIAALLVTHGHPDHAPNSARLKELSGAPVYGHRAARFPVDEYLDDRQALSFGSLSIAAIDAPGHTFDHLVFYHQGARALFTGDVVIGSGTVVIAPPGGAMRAYQATLQRLLDEFGNAATIYGGHGEPVTAPAAKLREYLAHRAEREAQIIAVLRAGPAVLPTIVEQAYATVDRRLWPAAARQVLAHLLALESEGRVTATPAARAPSTAEQQLLNPEFCSSPAT